MPSILFVCTANQFRSPLAAACLQKIVEQEPYAKQWTIESAGTWTPARVPAPKLTLQIAKYFELSGVDKHLSRQIDRNLLNQFDLILVMEEGHKEAITSEFPSVRGRVFLLSEIVDDIPYDIPDPATTVADPRTVALEIRDLITRGKEKILARADALASSRSQ